MNTNFSFRILTLAVFALCATKHSIIAQNEPFGGLIRVELQVDGVAREALVFAPASAKTTKAPLVFAFHGHSGTAANAAREYAMGRAWPEAIVVYMQGLNTPGRFIDPEGKQSGWQLRQGEQGDRDLKYFDAMIARMKQDYQVDDKRICAFGHSGGGYFVFLLWAARHDVLAAVAPMSSEAAEHLPVLKPKPALFLAGEKDSRVKYEWIRKTMDAMRQRNGCAAEGKPWGEHGTLYPSASGAPVVEFVHPGGHEVPKGAIAAIARFFKENPPQ